MKNKPGFNWIICGSKHHYKWNGVRGKDWNHEHKEFSVSFGKTVGYALVLRSNCFTRPKYCYHSRYEIYWAKGGEFWREGDGGYLNVSI